MAPVLQSAFLKALGWSLIDSLWQMGVVWVLYLAITRSGKKFNAEIRHNLALLSLATGSAWFLFTLIYNTFSGHPSTTSRLSSGLIGEVPGKLESILPLISVAYLLVTMILMVRLYRQLAYTGKLSTRGLKKADPEIRVFLQQLAGQMGIKKEIRVWISTLVETPLTVGFWKPVILLPVSIINNLSVKQTESIILHELYHIQRNDFVMNLLIAVADIILFFNPFARFFKDVIQKEREHRCDDMVIQYRYNATMYAQALLILEKQRPCHEPASAGADRKMSIAATGTTKMLLLARVKRLLTGETVATPVSNRLAAYLLTALFLGYVGFTGSIKMPVNSRQSRLASIAGLMPPGSGGSEEISQIFSTPPATDAGKSPARNGTSPAKGDRVQKPAAAYQNEDINIEKNLAQVIVSEKVEELISERARANEPEFVSEEKPLEYSISIPDTKEILPLPEKELETAAKPFPYVPGSSFLFKQLQDTADAGTDAAGSLLTELQLARTYAAIDEMDWATIEDNLSESGEDLNVERLQLELKKAVAEIDWKALSDDLSKGKKESIQQARKYRAQLADKYQKLETARAHKAECEKAAKLKLAQDRLKTHKPAIQHKSPARKKIVDI